MKLLIQLALFDMNVGIVAAKRIIKIRLNDFFGKSRYYGVTFASWDLLWWICFYTHMPISWTLSTFAIKRKTKWLDCYMERNYSDIIVAHSQAVASHNQNEHNEPRIWVFWGQGEADMPDLVRACYKQLTLLNNNVILVTKANLQKFLYIPKDVYRKVEQGDITWTHFSDIIRTSLLARYGGLWLDATVWVTRPFPFEKFAKLPFFSANGKVAVSGRSVRFWSSFQWNWSTWCMYAAMPNTLLFGFVSQMMQAIAIREKYWPDYVLQDYLIYYACRKFPSVGEAMAECNKFEFRSRNRLAELMNCPYCEDEYKTLTATDYIFKLSFRANWKPFTISGIPTYYGILIDNSR